MKTLTTEKESKERKNNFSKFINNTSRLPKEEVDSFKLQHDLLSFREAHKNKKVIK